MELILAGSSWYLLCENCREKYVKSGGRKQINIRHKSVTNRKIVTIKPTSPMVMSGLEPHVVMKNNAMFLLDLASSAESGMAHQRRSSGGIMPSVSENISPPDCVGPFGPLPPFQCLQSLGANLVRDEAPFYNDVLNKQEFQDAYSPGPSSSGQRVSL